MGCEGDTKTRLKAEEYKDGQYFCLLPGDIQNNGEVFENNFTIVCINYLDCVEISDHEQIFKNNTCITL